MNEQNLQEMSFEEALARLEELVRALEGGESGLQDSLSLFEEGIGLVRYCTETLDAAEQKVKILMQDAEGYREESFAEQNQ